MNWRHANIFVSRAEVNATTLQRVIASALATASVAVTTPLAAPWSVPALCQAALALVLHRHLSHRSHALKSVGGQELHPVALCRTAPWLLWAAGIALPTPTAVPRGLPTPPKAVFPSMEKTRRQTLRLAADTRAQVPRSAAGFPRRVVAPASASSIGFCAVVLRCRCQPALGVHWMHDHAVVSRNTGSGPFPELTTALGVGLRRNAHALVATFATKAAALSRVSLRAQLAASAARATPAAPSCSVFAGAQAVGSWRMPI
mmetsp:Transcript_75985/g.122724  ORF Transcript_75985/g.122724 Transcript_75985/m.122724 type:complete len:259 (-) Transcript_75985:408-1184(-)